MNSRPNGLLVAEGKKQDFIKENGITLVTWEHLVKVGDKKLSTVEASEKKNAHAKERAAARATADQLLKVATRL
jgi:hypothetical protein